MKRYVWFSSQIISNKNFYKDAQNAWDLGLRKIPKPVNVKAKEKDNKITKPTISFPISAQTIV